MVKAGSCTAVGLYPSDKYFPFSSIYDEHVVILCIFFR